MPRIQQRINKRIYRQCYDNRQQKGGAFNYPVFIGKRQYGGGIGSLLGKMISPLFRTGVRIAKNPQVRKLVKRAGKNLAESSLHEITEAVSGKKNLKKALGDAVKKSTRKTLSGGRRKEKRETASKTKKRKKKKTDNSIGGRRRNRVKRASTTTSRCKTRVKYDDIFGNA